jgi:hypothetical protein
MTGVATLARRGKHRLEHSPLDQALTDRRGVRGIARLRQAVEKKLTDERWGTPVGRMNLTGDATDLQFHAATQLASLRAIVDRIHGLPSRHIPAMDLNMVKGLSLIADRELDKDQATIRKYYAAEEAIGRGSPELSAVQFVVIYDNDPVSHEHRQALLRGLNRLVLHWKLRG